MALFFWIALVLGSLFIPVHSFHYHWNVYIDADRGNDGQDCLMSNSILKPCQTLSFVAENMTQRHDLVRIEIVSDRLDLTQPVEFNSWKDLTINGSGTLIHCNGSDAGIAFVNVKDLVIYSLTMEQCGAERNSTSFVDPHTANETERLNLTIYILNCTDVNISHVDIQDSHGTGLSMYDTNGTVDIAHCNFSNNSVSEGEEGGGGIHIEFTICSPGIVGHCSGHNGRNRDSKYTIRNCTFVKNMASCPFDKHTFIQSSGSTAIPRTGKGGGLYISICADATANNFHIFNCVFENNSVSFNGGGMIVEFMNSVQNNTVSVIQTSFSGNSCLEKHADRSSGGGLVLGFMFYPGSWVHKSRPPMGNSFKCSYCTFENNSAYMGGGAGIYATKNLISDSNLIGIVFSHCNWTNNRSPMGAAVFITPGIWDYSAKGFLPALVFSHCVFISNWANLQLKTVGTGVNVSSVGYGAVFSNEFKITFNKTSYFSGNKGSALYLLNSVVEFQEDSNSTFVNNTAHSGGAIAMYGSSVIEIHNNSTFLFIRNKAYMKGGAIYFNAALQYRNCFVQSTSQKYIEATLIFENNTAHCNVCGSDIFATTFQSCAVLCQNASITNPENILQCIADFRFHNKHNRRPTLVTNPEHFKLNTEKVEIIPGSEYYLPLSVSDEANNTLTGIVYEASVPHSGNITIDEAFSQVSNNVIRLLGNVNESAKLNLHANDMLVSFNVTLISCKPGYIHRKRTCECAASEYFGLEPTCDPNVCVKHGIWIGVCSHRSNKLCTAFCPFGMCSYHMMKPTAPTHPLPNDTALIDYQICGPYRTGRVCGHCVSGRSVYFHSYKFTCGPDKLCNIGWLFYLLSEIIPLILLFAIIIIFNISFTNGTVSSFVLFAQILGVLDINAKGSIEFKLFIEIIRRIVIFLYRPLNLDFFTLKQLSFCLWKGATVIDVLIMKYVTVGIALVLVVVTILIGHCRCIYSRTPKRVLIQSLSAFFVLCYSQCTQVTLFILNSFCLYSTNLYCEVKVVNYMGYMNYLEGEHVKYALIAIFSLIVMTIIPPLLLLLYPLVFKLLGLCKLSESKLAGVLWRVIPIQLLDAFQSSFKDEFRFFAGLYFLYRVMVLGAYAYTKTVLQFYSIVQLQLILVLTIHAIFQPHKERKHNIIDALVFMNLAIINSITLYNYSENDFRGNLSSEFAINFMGCVQCVLILLPLVSIIVFYIIKWKRRKKSETDSDELPPLRSGESRPLVQANYS